MFVGNLPFSTQESDLENLFAQNGLKTVSVVLPKANGRPKGFAFVSFEKEADTKAALALDQKLNLESRLLALQPSFK